MASEPMISAAKLEEVLAKRFHSKGTVHYDDLMAAIADIPAVDGATVQGDKDDNVPSKWISVKDRLPEDFAQVLICSVIGNQYVAQHLRGHFYSDGINIGTSHWMPLPQPPKGYSNASNL